jgi:Tfp pilus assembly protein PilO
MFGLSGKIILVQTVVLLSVCGLAYWYWNWSQTRISNLTEEAHTLRVAIETQNGAIASLEAHAADQANRISSLQQRLSGAESTRRRLETQLRQLNLALRSRTNPQDTEAEINRTINQLWQELRELTGGSSNNTPPTHTHQPPPRAPNRTGQP